MTDSENLDTATTGTAQAAQAAESDETTTAGSETAGKATTTTEETTMTTTATSATNQAEAATTTTAEELVDVETLGKDLPGWKLAGLMRHQRWASGKAVTQAAFDAALAAFEGRPLGGGR